MKERWHKQMERCIMFLDWKNQYCQNDYATQGNLQIQRNPSEIISGIFQRTRTIKCLICVKTQKTLHSQSNLETKRWNSRNQTPWLQIILQGYNKTVLLVREQKYRPMEQDRKRRDRPTSEQISSVARSCPTRCTPMNRRAPGLPVHHPLPEFMSIESVMPCSHLILCRPLLLLPPIPPSIRVFSNESTYLWSINLQKGTIHNGERHSLQ